MFGGFTGTKYILESVYFQQIVKFSLVSIVVKTFMNNLNEQRDPYKIGGTPSLLFL